MKQLLKYLYQNEEPGQMYVPTANTDFANSGHVTLLHVSQLTLGLLPLTLERDGIRPESPS